MKEEVGEGEVGGGTHTNSLLHLLGHLFSLLFHLVDDGIPNLSVLPGPAGGDVRGNMSGPTTVRVLTLYQHLATPSSTQSIPGHSVLPPQAHPAIKVSLAELGVIRTLHAIRTSP